MYWHCIRNRLRLDVDNLAAMVAALHRGGKGADEIHVCIGVANTTDVEGIAGNALIGVTVACHRTCLNMCAARGTCRVWSLGADKAYRRQSR